MVMEIHQLQYFVAVAEEASFTRAAARVHVAQPGVSAQVRRLEAELGQQLLDRSGRSVTLTEVGAAVLPFARAALDALDGARLAVDQLAGLVRGQVAVGMVSGCALPSLAELLADFHGRYPGVTIALAEDGSDRLVEQLLDGTLDLAEVKKAAAELFMRLDPDHDGTLDKRELAGRLSARELAAADPDHDGTLTLDEYLAVVEKRFNAANRDADGTLDAKELRTPAGRALLRLLK